MIVRVIVNIPEWLAGPLVWLLLLYRRLRYGCAFRKIPLTQGKFAIVDPEDYERLAKYRWHLSKSPTSSYAARWQRNLHTITFIEKKQLLSKHDSMHPCNFILRREA